MTTHTEFNAEPTDQPETIMEAKLWVNKGWTARVIKNEDDDGWAVQMIKDGEPEPALVGPWTMGRDKKNPKPLDVNAFNTLVKTASEVVRRHEQHMHALLHKKLMITVGHQQIQISLDIVPDEDEPHAVLSAHDLDGEQLAQVKVSAAFKLNSSSAHTWAENDYRKPG
jgi:hypothetical protein